jgi:hypothetical protein
MQHLVTVVGGHPVQIVRLVPAPSCIRQQSGRLTAPNSPGSLAMFTAMRRNEPDAMRCSPAFITRLNSHPR